MANIKYTGDYLYRGLPNETWYYPLTDGLIRLDKLPFLRPFYFKWETNFEGIPMLLFTRKHYWFGPTMTIVYLLSLYFGKKYMAKRGAFDLRVPLKYWNLALSLFSLWGSIRVVPHIAYVLWKYGFGTLMCSPPAWSCNKGPVALWSTLFVYSKYFELIDTAFIVLRKKKLSFLHWYHHATVLLYAWDGFAMEQPIGIIFTAMNYFVHTVMYYYYYVAAANQRPPAWGAIVTVFQILQMLIGVVVTGIGVVYATIYPFMVYSNVAQALQPLKYGKCYLVRWNLYAACLMYTTYFYLFAEFFVTRYIFLGKAKKSKTT